MSRRESLNAEDYPNWSLGLTQLEEEEKQAKEKLKNDARAKRAKRAKNQKSKTEYVSNEVVLDEDDELRHKCSPKKILNFLKILETHPNRDSRLESIRKAGFGGLLNLSYIVSIPNYFLVWAMKNFEEDGCYIRLDGDFRLKLTEDDVERVYTLPRGPKKINLEKEKKAARDRLREELGLEVVEKGTRVLTADLEKRLELITDETAWLKAAILYIIGCVLCPNAL